MFFLSSPPQPPPPQPQFFSNPFSFAHSPNTPSPLRTSYNANGVKRSRMSDQQQQAQSQSSPLLKLSNVWHTENDSENTFVQSTTCQTTAPASCSLRAAFNGAIAASSASTFTFSPSASLHPQPPTFAYESRARASSPARQLSSRAASTKAQNKARFLDRLRTRRDEGTGRDERALRADYLGERRAWEEEMARRARGEEGAGVEEEDIDDEAMEMEDENGGLEAAQSPTEEKEIEELVALLERQEDDGRMNGMGEEGDSQEWDEVFMEVLSQQEPQVLSQSLGQNDAGSTGDIDMS